LQYCTRSLVFNRFELNADLRRQRACEVQCRASHLTALRVFDGQSWTAQAECYAKLSRLNKVRNARVRRLLGLGGEDASNKSDYS